MMGVPNPCSGNIPYIVIMRFKQLPNIFLCNFHRLKKKFMIPNIQKQYLHHKSANSNFVSELKWRWKRESKQRQKKRTITVIYFLSSILSEGEVLVVVVYTLTKHLQNFCLQIYGLVSLWIILRRGSGINQFLLYTLFGRQTLSNKSCK